MCLTRKPLCVATSRKWDETREILTVRHDQDPGTGVADAWEVMVSSYRIVIHWPGKPMFCLDVVSPPAPLTSNAASNLLAAMQSHPAIIDHVKACEGIRRTAAWQLHSSECDGAAGNDKLHAYMSNSDLADSQCLYEIQLCGNHQQHLITISAINLMDVKLCGDMLAGSIFLAGYGHWHRMVVCTPKIVSERLVVRYDVPVQPGWRSFAEQLCTFLIRNMKTDLDNTEDDVAKSRRGQAILLQRLTRFMEIFNGPWWNEECQPWCLRVSEHCALKQLLGLRKNNTPHTRGAATLGGRFFL